jgi:hypothetical protein
MRTFSPATAGTTPSLTGPARPPLASRVRSAAAFLLPAALAVAAFIGPASATPAVSTNIEFGIYPHMSTSGQVPTQMNSNTPIVYTFTVNSGDAFSDTIPLNVCLDSVTTGDLTSWSDQVAKDNIAGDFSGDVTLSGSPWTFTDASLVSTGGHNASDTGCQSGSLAISIPAGMLTTVGNNVYTTNIHFKTQNNSNPSTPPKLVDTFGTAKHIQLQFNVVEAADSSRITCFMTDSEGNLLTDCNGDEVTASGAEDGVFAIVTKKNGGNPAGATGDISNITVPAGDTLYVTYHLEWDGVGKTANCGACGDQANAQVSVEGQVSGSFGGSPDICTSGALGYNKK